jgi:hypothetical protein
MRRQTPSLAPDFSCDTYLVVDELETCSVYREADEFEANRGDVIRQIVEGQFSKAVRVIAFNVAEGWARDATEDIANDIMHHALRKAKQLSRPAQEFVERVLKKDVPAGISAGY